MSVICIDSTSRSVTQRVSSGAFWFQKKLQFGMSFGPDAPQRADKTDAAAGWNKNWRRGSATRANMIEGNFNRAAFVISKKFWSQTLPNAVVLSSILRHDATVCLQPAGRKRRGTKASQMNTKMTKTQTPFTSLLESITGRAIQKKSRMNLQVVPKTLQTKKLGAKRFPFYQVSESCHHTCAVVFHSCFAA